PGRRGGGRLGRGPRPLPRSGPGLEHGGEPARGGAAHRLGRRTGRRIRRGAGADRPRRGDGPLRTGTGRPAVPPRRPAHALDGAAPLGRPGRPGPRRPAAPLPAAPPRPPVRPGGPRLSPEGRWRPGSLIRRRYRGARGQPLPLGDRRVCRWSPSVSGRRAGRAAARGTGRATAVRRLPGRRVAVCPARGGTAGGRGYAGTPPR